MAAQLFIGEESRELTDVTVDRNKDHQTSKTRTIYFGLVAVAVVLAVSCFGLVGISPSRLTSLKGTFPVSLFNSVRAELEPDCADFPSLHILEVVHSNLGGVGPDSGEEGLYYHVRSSKDRDFEMRVHAEHFMCPFPKLVGMHGLFATVNIASMSSVDLHFTFHDWQTKYPVTMDDFTLTFFDLDHGYGNAGLEELVIRGDWTQAVVAERTTLLVHQAEMSEHRIAFKATHEAMKPDEPKNPHNLTVTQFNKAVSLKFTRARKFSATIKVTTESQYPRFFEFLGQASILCAKDPSGGQLPIGEVYVNRDQLEKSQPVKLQEVVQRQSSGIWKILLGVALGLMAMALLYFWLTQGESSGYVAMAFQEDKRGPGLFAVTIPRGTAKMGVLLDAPEGINQPPMVKEVLNGAVKAFNESDPYNAIEQYDAIVGIGDATDPQEVVDVLFSELPEEVNLQLDRPETLKITLKGVALGAQLDALEDSFGAVIMDIEAGGGLAKWNAQNPERAINRGDRIIQVKGMDFHHRKGWKMRSPSREGENPFGSRSNSRFLEEMDELQDSDLDVTVLKYVSSEPKA